MRHSSQSLAEPIAFDCEGFMIESQQVQDRGVPILYADALLHRCKTQFIGFAQLEPALDPTAREPGANSVFIVIATGFARVFVPRELGYRQSSHLSSP